MRNVAFLAGRIILPVFCVLLMAPAPILCQQTSATLMGIVRDKQGGVVPSAHIVLINQAQGATVRDMKTEADGSFVITPLQPAAYSLQVDAPGFKKFEQKDIRLFANDRMSIPNIVLEVGALSETVTVSAETVQLSTASAERSGVVTGLQTVNLLLNGRNYIDLVKTVPGVVSTANVQVAGPGGIGNIYANGQRGNQNNVTLDGVTNMDTGSNGTQHTSLNIDAIAEVKMITNSQPAEFGRATGAQINVITKSGSRDFHGVGYWFHRHEGLNANNWRNNIDNQPRNKYRYNYEGYNIGGPIYWPGKFNSKKEKLFFFWGQEWQKQLIPNGARNVTVPTALQRQGDFSQTYEADGTTYVVVKDPTTGVAFPGNKIPQARWNADGAKILNWYPSPNVTNRPDYNYQTQVSSSYPRRQEIIRGDYNINDKWRAFFRMIQDKDDQIMPYGQWNADYNIPLGPMHFGQPGRSMIFNLTTIVNPTLTNEFIFGPSRNRLDINPVDNAWKRAPLNLSYQMPYPNADPLGLVQNWRFGVPNDPLHDVGGFSGTPFLNANTTFDFTDNVNKVIGGHTFKVGVYVQRSRKDQTATTSVNGTIDFSRDSANPGDSNWGYSNALLGNFRTLQQSNIVRNGRYRYTNAEWYVADNWKVTSNLTLDYGVRFYLVQPQFDAGGQTSSFYPGLFDPSQTAMLYQRAINPATGTAGALNPITGQFAPAALIGALIKNVGQWEGGAYDNGMGRSGVYGVPRGLIENRGVQYAPRVGMAWNFLPKTVLRMGGGVFYDRVEGNLVFNMLPNPPSTISPTIYYGNLATAASQPGVMFPGSVWGFSRDGHVPTTYNWNAGIQRELPFQVLLDVAYAGSVSRHLPFVQDINRPGFGSAWQPYSQDPTVAAKLDGTTNLPVNFYRPYQGYNAVQVYRFGGTSNYNSLQVAANRRFAKGLQVGLAYTFSKALGTASGNGDTLHPTDVRMGNYAPLTFDRRHYLVFNYIYELPKAARPGSFLDNIIGRAVLNHWTISGITTLTTGEPLNVTYGVAGVSGSLLNRTLTGDETWGPRPYVLKDPQPSNQGMYQWIDSTAFAPAVKGSKGLESAARGYIYGPGINNWDFSVFKDFPFDQEQKRRIELRLEMFNAPNHTQFSSVATGLTFDAAGKVTNLPTALGGTGGRYGFGTINGARDPRIIQLATKFYF